MPTALQDFLDSIRAIARGPAATEASYASPLQALLQAVAAQMGRPVAHVVVQPGQVTAAGAPDVAVYGPTSADLVGYVETKDVSKDLDDLAGHDLDQFKRYNAAFPVWILTNFVEFILFENRGEVERVTICNRADLVGGANLRAIAVARGAGLGRLLDRFLLHSTPVVNDPETLATLLANKARLLEDVLRTLLSKAPPDPQLNSQLEAYRRWLIVDLTPERFADFSAQTLTYGLFFAAYENSRRASPVAFERNNLLALLPPTIYPVYAIFQLLAAHLLPVELDWIIDDIIHVLAKADMRAIARGLGVSRDPTVFFYETFLARYDPDLRERLGVYYTPDQVVDFIVRSVDRILRDTFVRSEGLADTNVTVLDPALGTGTFLVHAFNQVAEDIGKSRAGVIPNHIRDHTLNNFYGFELLAAPYVLAHMKLGQVLESLGVSGQQPRVYLTNTLSDHQFPPTLPGPFEQAISEDGRAAQRVKAEERILVIIGNPPYSGTSYNIYNKVDDYRVPTERARNWLQNDYVKFIRWAEWKVGETEEGGYRHGVVGLITDHSYLSAPSFRGMRKHLRESFSRIFILNLHGNARIREALPVGVTVDENVFDIKQGTAIALFVREANHEGLGQVCYSEQWGDRKSKYDFLTSHDVGSTGWSILPAEPPFYFFVPRDLPDLTAEYQAWPSLTELMPLYSQAVVTARDRFIIDMNRSSLIARILDFAKATGTEADVGGRFGLRNTREFDIFEVQGRIREASPITRDPTTQQERISEDLFVPILFRPFDRRTIYYLEAAIEWPRFEIMQHLIRGDNMAFAAFRHTRRPTKGRIFVGREVIDARLLSSESNCLVFPFYRLLGIGRDGQTIIRTGDDVEREANLAAGVLATLTGAYGQPVSADNVFSYIYGVLNSPGYLSEFEALLHDDYPRIPFASDLDMFVEMAGLGRRILDLHLLEAQDIQGMGDLVCGFPVVGTDEVDRVAFRPSERRVYINASQYFDGVTPAMWDYQIGDYQPLKKWLEDRRGRTLDLVDQRHYMKFATAIQKVVSLSTQLDATWQVIRGSGWIRFVG